MTFLMQIKHLLKGQKSQKNVFPLISRHTFEDATKRQNKVPFKNHQSDFVYSEHKITGALSWHKRY